MATKTTWISDGDEWVFEEGELAKVTLRGQSRQISADFRVLKVINGATVETDLKGLSRYGWLGPVVSWAGDFKLEVDDSDGDTASSGEGEEPIS
ncbi:hypothetical protein [Paenarthrobacter ilicis]|uniref:Uncharacterized protein n=1 Tax=Paenarthrobacter ilicis TaxID=43665 RepID=A0ABX0TNL2_9MICC|nr:hypothetical protein [Paenarthrobacter ilicis]MBM7794443.1 hypothetical protein [Paenarthrobacter ilicis]NIJ02267.1 hypothetical protein [Paenarthrobacter ilicis]